MAHELKRSLHEVMGWPGPMTHRQFLVWTAWLKEQWNSPNRTDHYLMLLAQHLALMPARVWGKSGGHLSLSDCALSFMHKKPAKITQEQASKWAKAKWFGVTGFKRDKSEGGRPQSTEQEQRDQPLGNAERPRTMYEPPL